MVVLSFVTVLVVLFIESSLAHHDVLGIMKVAQELGEPLTVSGDSVGLTSLWHSLPNIVVNWLALYVDQVLLARGTRHWPEMLLG